MDKAGEEVSRQLGNGRKRWDRDAKVGTEGQNGYFMTVYQSPSPSPSQRFSPRCVYPSVLSSSQKTTEPHLNLAKICDSAARGVWPLALAKLHCMLQQIPPIAARPR
jgi:hypothetical protein